MIVQQKMIQYLLLTLALLHILPHSICSSSNGVGSNKRVVSPFIDLPPNVFAPKGRLYDVEDAVGAISSDHDPSSTTLVVLKCMNGIVIVTTCHRSPYTLQYGDASTVTGFLHDISEVTKNESNYGNFQSFMPSLSILDDSIVKNLEEHTLNPPFCRIEWPKQTPLKKSNIIDKNNTVCCVKFAYPEGRIVLAVTVGNTVESRILRHRIHQTTDRLRSSSVEQLCATTIARAIADQNQQRTQVLSSGRIVASTAVVMDCFYYNGRKSKATVHQVDPTGQFWFCQGVVTGRFATTIEQCLHELLEKQWAEVRPSNMNHADNSKSAIVASKAPTRDQACALLSQLSVEDALTLATKCIMEGIERIDKRKSYKLLDDDISGSCHSKTHLRGVAMSMENNLSVKSYSHYGLIARIQNA